MSQICKYVAIDGSVLNFGIDGNLYFGDGLRRHSYSYVAPYGQLLGFKNEDIVEYQTNIYISNKNKNSAKLRNEVFETFEKDIVYKNNNPLTNKYGRIYVNDYYLDCFVREMVSIGCLKTSRTLRQTISIITDCPNWIKEIDFFFTNLEEETSGKKYPYSYPYSYVTRGTKQKIQNFYITPVNFKMEIMAKDGKLVTNPYILIGEHKYQFNITLKENEKLVVDSIRKSIVHISGNGEISDVLYVRDKTSDIFKKIPIGESDVSISKNANVKITLLIERSEPEWN